MRNPKEVFTQDGYLDWLLTLRQLEQSVFQVLNAADDLHLGASDDSQITLFYKLRDLLESGILKTGDGEINE